MILPSPTVFMVSWLVGDTAISTLVGNRVGTRLDAVLPAIRVQRVGGVPDEPWRDNPEVQIECWAKDEGTAEKIALTVVDELPSIRRTFIGGRCYTYSISSGPFYSPDDPALSSNVRYILTVRLLVTK